MSLFKNLVLTTSLFMNSIMIYVISSNRIKQNKQKNKQQNFIRFFKKYHYI